MSLSNEEKKQFDELVRHLKAIVAQDNSVHIVEAKLEAALLRINRLENILKIAETKNELNGAIP
jgi:hypothetical protein